MSRTGRDEERLVLHVEGEVDLSNADAFRSELLRVMDGNGAPMTLDFSSCGFVDSTGLAVVCEAGQLRKAAAGRPFGLVAGGQPLRLFELTGVFTSGLFVRESTRHP